MDRQGIYFEDLVRAARHSPDFPKIVERIIGRELHHQRYRSKSGAEVFKTRPGRGESDYSALTLFYNPGGGWHVLDHKGRIGGDAISVLQQHYGLSFRQAVYQLAGHDPSTQTILPDAEKEWSALRAASSGSVFRAPEQRPAFKALSFSTGREGTVHLRAYLCRTRGIPSHLIDVLLSQGLIGESALNPYGRRPPCVVFNCRNKEGEIKGQFWRSTLSPAYVTEQNAPYQKGNVTGSDGSFPWVFTYAPQGATPSVTVICEAPIDAISLCALTGQPANYVAMGGLHLNSAERIRERFGENILLCVDNDQAGRAFTEKWIGLHPEDRDKVWLPDTGEVLEQDKMAGKEKADWNQNLKYRLEKDLFVALKEPARSEVLSYGISV